MSEQQQQAHISRVHLKGYKSIKDLEIDFKPGLNIVIGPNGSGKSNFLEFLDFIATFSRGIYGIGRMLNDLKIGFKWKISDSNNDKISLESSGKNINGKSVIELREIYENQIDGTSELYEYKIDHKKKLLLETPQKYYLSSNRLHNLFNSLIYIKFNNPLNSPNISDFMTVYIKNDGSYICTELFYENFDHSIFSFNSLGEIVSYLWLNQKTISVNLTNGRLRFSNFIRKIQSCSVIDDLRLDIKKIEESIVDAVEYFDIEEDAEEGYMLRNISNALQFKVSNNWLYWQGLSDGTKRIFYLLAEVYYNNSVIFVEEPELGIHPHQLSRLMDFLREQSETKQIIITTHSPQVLNELREDELDRIIVTRHEGERGTQMYHLSEEEKEFAKEYMSNGAFLSDYWVQSGFMQEEDIA